MPTVRRCLELVARECYFFRRAGLEGKADGKAGVGPNLKEVGGWEWAATAGLLVWPNQPAGAPTVALMRVMKQDGGATRLLNMKAGVPCNSERGSETLATFVGAVIFLRAFFEFYPDVRVMLAGGVLHQYDHATRQLVPVSEEEQYTFEKQRAAQWVAQKWDVEEAGL
jgi:hypothetical protein